jgi:beta-glucosidase
MNQATFQNFLWGVATSAHQIEGHLRNDMTEWESQGRFRSNGNNPIVGNAIDHWHRWENDFMLLKELGVNSYRFSVEWARLEPEPGRFDHKAIDQYRRMIGRLIEYGIVPMVTLHHFSNPAWLHIRCPWHRPEAATAYVNFAKIVSRELLENVPLVISFNEPMVWLLAAYGDAKFPPGFSDLRILSGALYSMLCAHRQAYDLIKADHPNISIGLAHNLIVFKEGRTGHFIDTKITQMIHEYYNMLIPRSFVENRLKFCFPLVFNIDMPIELENKIDFWGINYYYRMHVRFNPSLKLPFRLYFNPPAEHKKSDLGWEIYAKGLRRVCGWMNEFGKPLYITENGIAAEDDTRRVAYLTKHLNILKELKKEFPKISGYYHWSLMDNYEWLIGYKARFGLCHVDFDNDLKRTIKPSGHFYRDFILSHSDASASDIK